MGFGYSILLWIILQVFLSSAGIFQKLALKFQTFSIQIRWDILYNLMFANVINMCQNLQILKRELNASIFHFEVMPARGEFPCLL